MEFYLSIDGEKKGPFSMFRVGEMLECGEVDADNLAWHRGMESWQPISEVQALETIYSRHGVKTDEPPEPPGTEDEAPVRTQLPEDHGMPGKLMRDVRPFVRFWARMFDQMLITVIVWLVSDISIPAPVPGESVAEVTAKLAEFQQSDEGIAFARTLLAAMVCWHFLEAILIHLFATTPGKALFAIKVLNSDGSRLSLFRSLYRSFYVFVVGVGLYFWILPIIGMTLGFFRLLGSGKCLWDQQLDLRVETPPVGSVRIMLAIAAFLGLIMLQTLKFS